MTEAEKKFAEIQAHVDEICEKMHNITEEEKLKNAEVMMHWLTKVWVACRKWNSKRRCREKVYRDKPPKDSYYLWKDE